MVTDADRAAVAEGAVTVKQAQTEFGLSRSRLFALIKAGEIDSFFERSGRLITRRSLREYLARVYAASKHKGG